MFDKRTRLFVHFDILSFLKIFKSFIIKKKNFLDKLKEFLQVDNLILTSYGRTALYDIIKIIISKSGKKTFFIAPYTIPAVIHAIIYAGGEISYIDMNKNTGLIDQEKLANKIDQNTAGVIITHLYSNKEEIRKFINYFNDKIYIIEDAAINFGAKVDNKYLGTLADFGFFSFAMVKNLNTLTGGAIFIKDKNIFDEYILSRKTIQYPILKTINLLFTAIIIKLFFNNLSYQISHYFLKFIYSRKINFVLKKIYPVLFHQLEDKTPINYYYDFNWAMNEVGIYNLKKVKEQIQERNNKANLYNKIIKDEVAIKTDCLKGENALLEFPIILKKVTNQIAHDKLMEEGYDIRLTWYINNVKSNVNLSIDDFEDTNLIEKKIFCLPLHENIKTSDIKKISSIINNLN